MASWREFEEDAPGFASRVRALFDAHVHKTIATLRADGSPRISGTECMFAEGDLWFGSMPGARKAKDLQRDPRFAFHSGSDDPSQWTADAKLSGRVEEVDDRDVRKAVFGSEESAGGSSHLFRADIAEVVITGLNEARNKLVIELWKPGEGVKRVERD